MGFANGGKGSAPSRAATGKGKGSSSSSPANNDCVKSFSQDPNKNYTASTDGSSDEEDSSEEEVLSEHAEFDNIEDDWKSEIENDACKDLFSDEHFNNIEECLSSMKKNHFGFSFVNIKNAFMKKLGAKEDAHFAMYEHIRVVNFFRLRGCHASRKLLEECSVVGANENHEIDYEKLLFGEENKRLWTDDAFLCPAMSSDPLLEYWTYFEDDEMASEAENAPVVCNNVIMEMVPNKDEGKIAELDPDLLDQIRREG